MPTAFGREGTLRKPGNENRTGDRSCVTRLENALWADIALQRRPVATGEVSILGFLTGKDAIVAKSQL